MLTQNSNRSELLHQDLAQAAEKNAFEASEKDEQWLHEGLEEEPLLQMAADCQLRRNRFRLHYRPGKVRFLSSVFHVIVLAFGGLKIQTPNPMNSKAASLVIRLTCLSTLFAFSHSFVVATWIRLLEFGHLKFATSNLRWNPQLRGVLLCRQVHVR